MATTTNFGWDTPDDTDLVKDGAAAIRTLGNSIDTSFVDLKGGTTGQVLAKASNTDLDYTWVAQDDSNAIQNAIVDAKGDLISATAADTPARLAVGTNGQVLTADSTTSTGLKWETPASGGKILQVVSAVTSTSTNITTNSYTDITNATASITPSSASSKILILASLPIGLYRASTQVWANYQLLRDSTAIYSPRNGYNGYGVGAYEQNNASLEVGHVVTFTYLDSPSTTSSTTYKLQGAAPVTGNSLAANFGGGVDGISIILMEVGP